MEKRLTELDVKFEALKESMVLALGAIFEEMPDARTKTIKALREYLVADAGEGRETVKVIIDDLLFGA